MAESIEAAFVALGSNDVVGHDGKQLVGVHAVARALALAAHDDACLACNSTTSNPAAWYQNQVELRRRECKRRARIEKLGR